MATKAVLAARMMVASAIFTAAIAGETMDWTKLDFERQAITYKTIGDVELRLHGFLPPGWDRGDRRPTIVFFFGGGWRVGSPQQFHPHCAYLASRGMVAASAEYRVKNRHGTNPIECVKDGNAAVRWLRAHAQDLGIDPERIAAGGASAGGMIAACTALTPGIQEDGENTEVSSQADALILFNPVVDMVRLAEMLGLSPDDAESVSPLHQVRKGLPPCIIFHGEEDKTVPIERVRTFCRHMKKAENRCEVVGYDGVGHRFFNYGRDEEHAYFRDTVYRSDRFLASLGWLEGEPTIQPPQKLPGDD
jgi:acetyl esterase/lipase